MTGKAANPVWLLGLVVLAPVALALLFFYGPRDWLPRGGAAHGDLIDPTIQAPIGALPTPGGAQTASDWFRDRWSLIYVQSGGCGAPCLDRLNRLNQVRLRLGRDSDRVRLVLLVDGPTPETPQIAGVPGLVVAGLDGAAGRRWLDALAAWPLDAGAVFVADPLGNLLLRYPSDVEQTGLLEDLERLLEISSIG